MTAPAANEAPAGASSCRVIVAAGSALLLLLTAAATLGGPHPEPPVSSAPHPEAPPVERVAPHHNQGRAARHVVAHDDEAKPVARRSSSPQPSTARRLLSPVAAATRQTPDKHGSCGSWADQGECEKNPAFMLADCAASCGKRPRDQLPTPECVALSERGGCHTLRGATECSFTCLQWLQHTLTPDKEGNCWYWSTDGECAANPVWMNSTCPRSCALLHHCAVAPEGEVCMKPFECPPQRDQQPDCPARALRGECRTQEPWGSASTALRCSASCHLLDPPAVSHTVTRPGVRRNARVDMPPHRGAAIYRRHSPTHCHLGKEHLHALLGASCPNRRLHPSLAPPWVRHRLRCPRRALEMTPRLRVPSGASPLLPPSDGPSLPEELRERAAGVVVQHVWESPRVRLLHNFISAEDAQAIIQLATPHYHRSSTARAGNDESRTSHSAMLPTNHPAVASLRQLIAHFAGYPEHNLEPLQAVKYLPGEYYKPHHDYYNACETWLDGNRHFTFLVYLNTVEGGGGETRFPHLNLTVSSRAYSALLFNNCLDNGEPDERSQHEGVAPSAGVKYAINGWMRSKNLRAARMF